MYGAGSIGRGFIGPLFAQAGYEIVFIDINLQIIYALNDKLSYKYSIIADVPYDVKVSRARGVDGRDELAVVSEIASCDIMATALGAPVLQKVAPLLAKGICERARQSRGPLNILICENLKNAAHLLRGWIGAAMPEADESMLLSRCGLIETAIGRMVPVAAPNLEDPLRVAVEEYGFLPVDRDAFIGAPPEIEGLIPYSPFSFYEERKLYLHNMGHAICAYLGAMHNIETIAGAISDPSIRLLTQCAMIESAAMLSKKYSVPFAGIYDHAEDLLLRFGNAALGDTCERVCRDPMRKLKAGDRLAGAMAQCREHGIHTVYIALGYAAALRYVTRDAGLAMHIAMETGLLDDGQTKIVAQLFDILDLPMDDIISTIDKMKKGLRGNIV